MSTENNEWTVKSMLEWATGYFQGKGIPDPRHSIEWLLAETLGTKRLDLYLCFDRPLSPSELEQLRPLVKRRAAHEPLQYITGYSQFMHARIDVTPRVLIPRIETEQLVEMILGDHAPKSNLPVLDIGTGSGCIPIALKMEQPSWRISAFDISDDALRVARKNADINEVEINFVQGDINRPEELPFTGPFELIVSNPPYVQPDEKNTLEPQVIDHEPSEALFCKNIEQLYTNIIDYARQMLVGSGMLYLEINERHGTLITDLFPNEIWDVDLRKDYQGKHRFIAAKYLQ